MSKLRQGAPRLTVFNSYVLVCFWWPEQRRNHWGGRESSILDNIMFANDTNLFLTGKSQPRSPLFLVLCLQFRLRPQILGALPPTFDLWLRTWTQPNYFFLTLFMNLFSESYFLCLWLICRTILHCINFILYILNIYILSKTTYHVLMIWNINNDIAWV